MINQIMLVGRLVRTPELFVTESGKKGSFITLAVGRPYKNADGEYEADFIDCTLWAVVAENTAEYCKTGDIVGIRGRIQTRIAEDDNGMKQKIMEIIADKVTFLASSNSRKDGETELPKECENEVADVKPNTDKNKSDKKK